MGRQRSPLVKECGDVVETIVVYPAFFKCATSDREGGRGWHRFGGNSGFSGRG